jgi:hypothetical protein
MTGNKRNLRLIKDDIATLMIMSPLTIKVSGLLFYTFIYRNTETRYYKKWRADCSL